MTEQEARQIICPKYKAALLSNPKMTLGGTLKVKVDMDAVDKFCKCDGPDCACWTWDETEYEYSGGKVDDSGWEEVAVGYWRKKRENREGFCGFGGSR